MHVNAAGRDLIRRFEGLRLKVYLCPAGKQTVGYGHRTGMAVGSSITTLEADRFLEEDLGKAEAIVDTAIAGAAAPLNENQYSALVSLVFNIGAVQFAPSHLASYVRLGDFAAAAEEFLRWNHINGVVNDGLTARREAERELFLRAP